MFVIYLLSLCVFFLYIYEQCTSVILALRRLKQKNHKFKDILVIGQWGYIERSCLKNKTKQNKTKQQQQAYARAHTHTHTHTQNPSKLQWSKLLISLSITRAAERIRETSYLQFMKNHKIVCIVLKITCEYICLHVHIYTGVGALRSQRHPIPWSCGNRWL